MKPTTTIYSPGSGLFSTSYTFSAKEKDSETGLTVTSLRSDSSSSLSKGQTSLSLHSLIRRFGARYYSSDLSIWLSVDPMSDKYPNLSPFTYCANNPIKLVDPNGEEFVGTDGKKVNVKQDKNGQIHIGDNASEDLKRMASMINNSGSKTAAKQFMKLANNRCKIHFQIIQGERDGSRIGYHQAHDSQGNKLDWVGDRDNGYFEGTPAIQKGEYKEATITLFEGMADQHKTKTPYQSNNLENTMVGTFAHEAEHNTNKSDIRAIKERSAGYSDNVRDVERAAERIERKVYHEIYKNR